MLDFRRRLSVVAACFTMRHQRFMGKTGLQLQRIATEWSLKVPMAFSAALFMCRFGRTSWKLTFSILKILTNAVHSLSNICSFGCNPLSFKYVCIAVIAVRRSCSDLVLIRYTRIAFEFWSYVIMIYWLPLLDLFGNLPFWSGKKLPLISMHLIVTVFCWTLFILDFVVISLSAGWVSWLLLTFCFMDRRFYRICLMCPFVVANDFGRCLHTM